MNQNGCLAGLFDGKHPVLDYLKFPLVYSVCISKNSDHFFSKTFFFSSEKPYL